MLSFITPKWPRAFTSIGVGSVPLYTTFQTRAQAFNDVAIEFENATDLTEPWQQLNELVLSLEGNFLLIASFAVVFIAYTLGEAFILVGRILICDSINSTADSKRLSEVATMNNNLLSEMFGKRQSNIDLMCGISFALASYAIASLVHYLDNSNGYESYLSEIFQFGILSLACAGIARFQLAQIDKDISEVKQKLS